MRMMKEMWENLWIIPLVLVLLGGVRMWSEIRKGFVTARKPFVKTLPWEQEDHESIGYEAATVPAAYTADSAR